MSEHHGKVWWSELMTRDVPRSVDYYGQLCGWTFDAMPMPDSETGYRVANREGRPVAGIMDMTGMEQLKDAPAHWFTYLAVADVDAAAKATEAAGGQVLRAPWDVPGVGRIAIVTDPGGAAVGLMTPAEPGH
ncbi:VOC family protein [Tranquillimonas alkanivorans]|uniref:VOC domain-containing protein n=1 Tax=Tranquillimonas alkanivorans TaxID=441119 RepID=A0A1I5KRX3_9RHOB|nr:VOC family protein [Tranquillimonas alkanivorans]SFO87708.1 hypothetical protein SAMN04488047_101279 [Tranquillimonas alkanivorans]